MPGIRVVAVQRVHIDSGGGGVVGGVRRGVNRRVGRRFERATRRSPSRGVEGASVPRASIGPASCAASSAASGELGVPVSSAASWAASGMPGSAVSPAASGAPRGPESSLKVTSAPASAGSPLTPRVRDACRDGRRRRDGESLRGLTRRTHPEVLHGREDVTGRGESARKSSPHGSPHGTRLPSLPHQVGRSARHRAP